MMKPLFSYRYKSFWQQNITCSENRESGFGPVPAKIPISPVGHSSNIRITSSTAPFWYMVKRVTVPPSKINSISTDNDRRKKRVSEDGNISKRACPVICI